MVEHQFIKLAFYTGKGDDRFSRFIIPLIRFWDRNLISHSEIIFTDSEGNEHWISSRPEGVTDRVNYKYDPKEWIFVDVPVSELQIMDMQDFIQTEVLESKYDWIGIMFSVIIPVRFESRKNWFCSELCRASLRVGEIPYMDWSIPDHTVTPAQLFYEVKQLFGARVTFPTGLFGS